MNLAALANLSPEARDSALNSFVDRGHSLNGEAAFIDERILKLEQRYEMSSDEMRTSFQSGNITETADICSWLMLLEARDGLSAQRSS